MTTSEAVELNLLGPWASSSVAVIRAPRVSGCERATRIVLRPDTVPLHDPRTREPDLSLMVALLAAEVVTSSAAEVLPARNLAEIAPVRLRNSPKIVACRVRTWRVAPSQ